MVSLLHWAFVLTLNASRFAFKYHFQLLAVCRDCKNAKKTALICESKFGGISTQIASLSNRIHLWKGLTSSFLADFLLIPYYTEKPVPLEKELLWVLKCDEVMLDLRNKLEIYDGKLPLEEFIVTRAGNMKNIKSLVHLRIQPFTDTAIDSYIPELSKIIIQHLESQNHTQSLAIPLLRPPSSSSEMQLRIACELLKSLISLSPFLQTHAISIHLIAPDSETEPTFPSTRLLEDCLKMEDSIGNSLSNSSTATFEAIHEPSSHEIQALQQVPVFPSTEDYLEGSVAVPAENQVEEALFEDFGTKERFFKILAHPAFEPPHSRSSIESQLKPGFVNDSEALEPPTPLLSRTRPTALGVPLDGSDSPSTHISSFDFESMLAEIDALPDMT